MSSRRGFIHLSRSNRSILISFSHKRFNLLIRINLMLRKILYINSQKFTLSNFQTSRRSTTKINHQVLHTLIVNLNHWATHIIPLILSSSRSDSFKQLIRSNWNYSSVLLVPDHRVRLSTPSLAICKQAAVISLPCIIKHLFSKTIVHVHLIIVFGSCCHK